jgi:hypothetical protein
MLRPIGPLQPPEDPSSGRKPWGQGQPRGMEEADCSEDIESSVHLLPISYFVG